MRLLQHEEKTEIASLQTQAEEVTRQTAPIARLQKAILRRKNNVKFANTTAWVALFLELLTAPLLFYIGSGSNALFFPALAIWVGFYLPAAALCLPYTWLGKRELERSITDLAEGTDCNAIGPLIDMVAFYDPYNAFSTFGSDYRAYQAAVQALTPLLSRLSGEESTVVSIEQRLRLPLILKHAANSRNKRRYNIPFALAILKALEEIGDSTAIPTLLRLAKMTPRDDEQRMLREAAEICLSRLRERDQEVDQQKSLLRASSSIPTDTLLRAVSDTPTTDPMQLLRPGQEDQ